jgi:ribonucleoside-diphosphate reductase beta chain
LQKIEKKLLNGKSDLNVIVPIKYQWAWKAYQTGNANHWTPQEVDMSKDIDQWKTPGAFTKQERDIVERCLGFFSTADSLAANNIVFAIYKHLTAPECRLFLSRQALEEVVHQISYQHIIESLSMDEDKLFNMYHEIPSVAAKASYNLKYTQDLSDQNFHTNSIENIQRLLKNLVAYVIVMEGLFFYVGFVQLFAFGRQNRLPGTVEQIKMIQKDEHNHISFGVSLINGIKEENPGVWTKEFQKECQDIILEGLDLEIAYAKDTMPIGMLGLNATLFEQYLKYICNRRFIQIGLKRLFDGVKNPFPWLTNQVDLQREANFFEKTVTAYQSAASLNWD